MDFSYLKNPIVAGIIGTLVASAVLGFIAWALQDGPAKPLTTPDEAALDLVVEQTRTANIWERPPVMFAESLALLREHASEWSPRHTNRFSPVKPLLPVREAVANAGLWAGRQVSVFGVLSKGQFILGPAPNTGDWVAQLVDPLDFVDYDSGPRNGVVYVRVTRPLDEPLEEGVRVATGVIVGAGNIIKPGAGFDQASYMLGQSVSSRGQAIALLRRECGPPCRDLVRMPRRVGG